jgi:hypothetical protein
LNELDRRQRPARDQRRCVGEREQAGIGRNGMIRLSGY